MHQIPLSLVLPSNQEIREFFVTGANQLAYGWIESWPNWPAPYHAVNIHGPRGCGKSHLGALYQQKCHVLTLNDLKQFNRDGLNGYDGVLLEGVSYGDNWHEEALFHFMNYLAETGKSALITSQMPLSQMPWRLADVSSRMRAIASQNVDMPDDDLLAALLDDYFTRRQCQVPEPVLRYILLRVERSYEAVSAIAHAIDKISLAQKRPVTTALIKPLFENPQQSPEQIEDI